MKNKIIRYWQNFWGTKYWIIENGIKIKEILIYHKKIFIKDLRKEN